MIDVSPILQYLTLITLIIGACAYIYKTVKDSSVHYDQDTITRLNESRDILKEENVELRSKLATMEARIKTLEQNNEYLKNLVTGKDTLMELQKTLNQFLPYAGAFEDFKRNDQIIVERLDVITQLIHDKFGEPVKEKRARKS